MKAANAGSKAPATPAQKPIIVDADEFDDED